MSDDLEKPSDKEQGTLDLTTEQQILYSCVIFCSYVYFSPVYGVSFIATDTFIQTYTKLK